MTDFGPTNDLVFGKMFSKTKRCLMDNFSTDFFLVSIICINGQTDIRDMK